MASFSQSLSEGIFLRVGNVEEVNRCTEAKNKSTLALAESEWVTLEKFSRNEIMDCGYELDGISSGYGSLLVALLEQFKFEEAIYEGGNCIRKVKFSSECHFNLARAHWFVGDIAKFNHHISIFNSVADLELRESREKISGYFHQLNNANGLSSKLIMANIKAMRAKIYKLESMRQYSKDNFWR